MATSRYTKYSSHAPALDQYAAHLKNADQNLASEAIGKARIDCRLLTSQSEWATVGQPPNEYMTGSLFVKVQFFQPREYALENATIWMEFDSPITSGGAAGSGPLIVDHQPVQLCGLPAERHVSKATEFNPNIDIGIGGGGLGSLSRSTDYTQAYRWTFSGQTHVSEGGVLYNRLTWKWEDQTKGSQLPFQRPIYAAVVIQHDTNPFVIHARIEGKLKSLRHVYRRWKLPKPGIKAGHLIEPVKSISEQDLQKLVQGLEKDIFDRNERGKAKEMVDIQHAVMT